MHSYYVVAAGVWWESYHLSIFAFVGEYQWLRWRWDGCDGMKPQDEDARFPARSVVLSVCAGVS